MPEKNPEHVIQDWPKESKQVAQDAIQQFGQPDEVNQRQLIWYDTPPWKRTVVHKEPFQHNFPTPHTDVMEQVIDYQVPPDRYTDATIFDGSIMLSRTRGELYVMCHWESANYLAANLLHQILQGELNVDEARQRYAEVMVARQLDKESRLIKELIFEPPTGDTTDPDEEYVTEELKQEIEQKLEGKQGDPVEILH